jgi:hypothetical protein
MTSQIVSITKRYHRPIYQQDDRFWHEVDTERFLFVLGSIDKVTCQEVFFRSRSCPLPSAIRTDP